MSDKFPHGKPVTRREFVALGLMKAPALLMMPSLASIVAREARAADDPCAASAAGGAIPLLVFDAVGGAAIAGNFAPLRQGADNGGGALLPSYDTLGAGSGTPTLDKRFGAPMFQASALLAGMTGRMSADAQATFRWATIATPLLDDTSSNPTNPAIAIARAVGLAGEVFPALGTQSGSSGGHSSALVTDAALTPVFVDTPDRILSSASLGTGISALPAAQKNRLLDAISKLNLSQLKRLSRMTLFDQLSAIAGCSATKVARQVGDPGAVDGRRNSLVQTAYGVTAADTSDNARNASIAYNVLSGQAGYGVITIEGCDYHNGTRTTGDAKDREIGTQIGNAIALAAAMKKPLFVCLITDGGISSSPGSPNWNGDSGQRAMAAMGYYSPTAPAQLSVTQAGSFTDGQVNDTAHYVAATPKRVAQVMTLNYLSLLNRAADFQKAFPDFDRNRIDENTLFRKS